MVPEAPSRPQGGGRSRHGDGEVLAAIVFVVTSGCTMQQLPSASFGPSGPTAHRRFAERHGRTGGGGEQLADAPTPSRGVRRTGPAGPGLHISRPVVQTIVGTRAVTGQPPRLRRVARLAGISSATGRLTVQPAQPGHGFPVKVGVRSRGRASSMVSPPFKRSGRAGIVISALR